MPPKLLVTEYADSTILEFYLISEVFGVLISYFVIPKDCQSFRGMDWNPRRSTDLRLPTTLAPHLDTGHIVSQDPIRLETSLTVDTARCKFTLDCSGDVIAIEYDVRSITGGLSSKSLIGEMLF